MAGLITQYGFGTVFIILLIAIPCIIGFISWCKSIWAKREKFKQDNIQKGKEIEARAEEKEARLVKGEARMDALERNVLELTEMVKRQQALIELLIKSDELDIKSWIKAQHERWIPLGCIDSQTLELLSQRYAVYTKEGGNSWAEKLVSELRALPTVTVIPVKDIHEEDNSSS